MTLGGHLKANFSIKELQEALDRESLYDK